MKSYTVSVYRGWADPVPVTHTPVRTSPPSVVLIPLCCVYPSWNVAKTRADIITAPTPLSRAGHYPHRPPDSLRLLARPVVHQMPRVVLPAHTHIRLQSNQKQRQSARCAEGFAPLGPRKLPLVWLVLLRRAVHPRPLRRLLPSPRARVARTRRPVLRRATKHSSEERREI